MNVVFVAAGPYAWGSSRMRAYWVAAEMGAAVVQYGDPLPDADVYIWQKSADLEFIKAHKGGRFSRATVMTDPTPIYVERDNAAPRHYWDVCDPMWWFSPAEIDDLLPHLAGVVCSTSALACDLVDWANRGDNGPPVPLHVIPDRLNLEHFPIKHGPNNGGPIRFIWYGVAVNRVALSGAMINLARLHANGYEIALTVFDDQPSVPMGRFDFPIYHIQWDLAKENAVIASHDIALLPPYPGPWGAVKSNNKTVTAWACGVPTTDGLNYEALKTVIKQTRAGMSYIPNVAEKYDVALSAREWEAIICPS